jgi:acyl-CoA synthetase (AMP-forming)/AMP-acid ligase II
MNLVDILREHARERGDHIALRETSGASVTFQELDDAVSRMASMLRASGLHPADGERTGDVVLMLQPVSLTLYVVLIAVLRARLTAMFVDPGAGRAAIAHACDMIRPRAMVGNTRACLYRLASPSLRRIPVAFTTGALPVARRLDHRRHEPLAAEPCADTTPALLTFTSGSTGAPKVAVRSHGFLLAQHRALSPTLGLGSDREYAATTFPVFVLSHLASRAATLLCADASPAHMAGITVIDAAPAWCEQLMESCKAQNVRLDGVRRVIVGGGPVFPRLLDALQACAPNAHITTLYGSTEAEPIAHIDRESTSVDDLRDMRGGRGLLVGAPGGDIDLRVLRDDSRALRLTRAEFEAACLPSGGAGEIVVSGAHVLPGYYRGMRDEETKFRVDDTVWHRTGDAGFLDAQGRVWLLGRLAARIRDEKGELFPFQVEAAASEEPGVRRSALVARNGKRVLLVELAPGAASETLQQLRTRLGWAQLDRVVECGRIPIDRRHHSKVDYGALEKLAID